MHYSFAHQVYMTRILFSKQVLDVSLSEVGQDNITTSVFMVFIWAYRNCKEIQLQVHLVHVTN